YFSYLAETIKQQPAIMHRRKNLRAIGVDYSVPNPNLIDPVHQLRDQIKIETRAAESRNLPLGRDNHMRVFNRVIEIVPGHLCVNKVALRPLKFKSVGTPRAA